MSSNRFTRYNSNNLSDVDESERLMKCKLAANESSYHMPREWRKIFGQEDEILDAWTQFLENHDGERAEIVDGDIRIKAIESDLNRERAQTTKDLT